MYYTKSTFTSCLCLYIRQDSRYTMVQFALAKSRSHKESGCCCRYMWPTNTHMLIMAPLEDQRSILEERAFALKRELSTVNRALNSWTPDARLPPELLSTIFVSCTESSPRSAQEIQLLVITHTSYRWREVALACERLWTRILIPASPGFLDAALKRSGDSLFELTVTGAFIPLKTFAYQGHTHAQKDLTSLVVDNITRAFHHIHRMKGLKIFNSTLLNAIQDGLGPGFLTAPNLHELMLQVDRVTLRPALSSLFRSPNLSYCQVAFRCADIWRHLSSCASLQDLSVDLRSTADAASILSALSALPELRTLSLTIKQESCRNEGPHNHSSAMPPVGGGKGVSLPHLCHLALSGCGLFWSLLSQHLVFPPTVYVRIDNILWPLSRADGAQVVRSIISNFVRGAQILEICPHGDEGSLLRFIWSNRPGCGPYMPTEPLLQVDIPAAAGLMMVVAENFALDKVDEVCLRDLPNDEPIFSSLQYLRKNLTDVTNLSFDGCDMAVIQEILDSSESGAFPMLVHLRVDGLEPIPFDSPSEDECAFCIHTLLFALRRRRKVLQTRDRLDTLQPPVAMPMTEEELIEFLDVEEEVEDDSESENSVLSVECAKTEG